MSEAPTQFVSEHANTLARLYKRAGGARWNVDEESLCDAAYRAARAIDRASVDAFLDAIHAEDLCLALACQAGNSAAWEHFITGCRPALYAAARAIAGDEARGCELADSIWAEMYGLEVRDGHRRSILSYFHGRSSILTWMRAVLAQRHVDYIRSHGRLQALDDHLEQTPTTDCDHSDATDPDRARYVAMLGKALDAALESLEPRDRMRMAYYYRHDLSLKQIGRIMDEHESTVSRQLARTRDHLKRETERALRESDKLSHDQIKLCYEFAAGDLRIDLARALPDIDLQTSGRDTFKERGHVSLEGRRSK
ncbi:MAG TPA: sigma-70 family RNA polymerase sigma factor [Candidatus Binatus sp.]|nr:sigma-70 family RNA polymerase sigma factor [Candidatus Binatus sp.]